MANQPGYLRLGVELLKAAYAPAGLANQPHAVPVNLHYLFTADSTLLFDWFERREPDAPQFVRYRTDWILVVMFIAMAVLFGLMVVGLVTTFNWLWSF